MSTLSLLPSPIAVFGGTDTTEAAVDQISKALDAEVTRTELDLKTRICVCVHTGVATPSLATSQAVHINVDLPEIVISPVLGSDQTVCLACYQRRRNQHNIDPRLEDEGTMPFVRPRVTGLPISRTATSIVASRVLASVHNWVEGNDKRNDFSLYRTSINQLSIGRVMAYSGCPCSRQETKGVRPDE